MQGKMTSGPGKVRIRVLQVQKPIGVAYLVRYIICKDKRPVVCYKVKPL